MPLANKSSEVPEATSSEAAKDADRDQMHKNHKSLSKKTAQSELNKRLRKCGKKAQTKTLASESGSSEK